MSLARRAVLRAAPGLLAPAALRLRRALRDPVAAQDALRRHIASDLSATEYGRAWRVRGAEDFDRLPVAEWSDLAPWVDRQRMRRAPVLFAEPVRFHERTSGSGGVAKDVPYTATLRRTFSEMFAAWACDVLARGPALSTGRLYMATSPPLEGANGLDDDAEYLDAWLQPLVRPFLVGPSAGRRHASGEAFLDAVADALRDARDLEVISVWSPTFLEVVLQRMAARHGPIDPAALWPRLRLLSCWDQGPAAAGAARLRRRLPGVLVQGKGLLATEAPVTVPWLGANGCVPLVHTTVIELVDGDRLRPVHEAVIGETYEIVVSPRGGFARYRLGDRVRATHRHHGVPCLRFEGRSGGGSDLVGEKLDAAYVDGVLSGAVPAETTATLVPVSGPPARYVLLADGPLDPGAVASVEARLREAHHYRLAQDLGQLAPLRAVSTPEAGRWLLERSVRRGLAWGDVKPRALEPVPADAVLAAQLGEG